MCGFDRFGGFISPRLARARARTHVRGVNETLKTRETLTPLDSDLPSSAGSGSRALSAPTPLPRELEDEVVELLARMLVNDLRLSRNTASSRADVEPTDVPPSGYAREPLPQVLAPRSVARQRTRKSSQRPT
jgi:hypothetical protein